MSTAATPGVKTRRPASEQKSTPPAWLRRAGVVDEIEMSDVLCVDATDVVGVDITNALAADTTDVLSADATDVMSAHTTHIK